jgi:hypothetical protein
MKKVTGLVSVRKCGCSHEFTVTAWNATSFEDDDDDDDNNNFVIDIINVNKSLRVLFHYSSEFFCQSPFELNIRIFTEFIDFFLTEQSPARHCSSGCEHLNLTYDE